MSTALVAPRQSVASLRGFASARSFVPAGFAHLVRHNSTSTPRANVATLHYNRAELPINFGINFVPTQSAYVIERFGKFHKILEPGLNWNVPIIDRIAYVQNLKELPIEISPQTAITTDNVGIDIDGVLYIRVVDPYKASYGVDDAVYAISQLAQTTMRSEIGSMTLDQSLKERATLNARITQAVNEATHDWGVRVMRYEIRNINPPEAVIHSMHLQVSAERTKRAQILDAEGQKQSAILVSEARKTESINVARGEAEATLLRAEATANSLLTVGRAIAAEGADAVQLRVAEKWIEAFAKLAKEGNTMLIPSEVGNPAGIVAQAMAIFKNLSTSAAGRSAGSANEARTEISAKVDAPAQPTPPTPPATSVPSSP